MRIINCNFYDFSIITAPLLFYIGILSFAFSENLLNIFLFLSIPVCFFYCLISSLIILLNFKKVKKLPIKLLILLAPFLLFPSIKIIKCFQKETVLEAQNEGIISGKKLYLYKDKEFKFTESSLSGTNIRNGKYSVLGNVILLNFDSDNQFQLNKLSLKIGKNYIEPIGNDSISTFEIIKNKINSASH